MGYSSTTPSNSLPVALSHHRIQNTICGTEAMGLRNGLQCVFRLLSLRRHWGRGICFSFCGVCDSCGGISYARMLCGKPKSVLVDVVFALTTFDSVQYLLVGWLFKIGNGVLNHVVNKCVATDFRCSGVADELYGNPSRSQLTVLAYTTTSLRRPFPRSFPPPLPRRFRPPFRLHLLLPLP